jgi:bifunctional UDP-N-acetylglucosamine pyrophosphorylase/glucosamine-1-phosphate N-acetyltransferase
MSKAALAVVILAAGKGTRMKSELPKVLHPLLGRPMLGYVLDAVKRLKPAKNIMVVGHQAERVKEAFREWRGTFVNQAPQLGTGHALQITQEELKSFQGIVLVLSGDVPLIETGTLKKMLQLHRKTEAVLTLISAEVNDPKGYGRIIRNTQKQLVRIVEEKDASRQERSIREINTGLYAFNSEFLSSALSGLTPKNRQKEYYLTDVVQLARGKGLPVAVLCHSNTDEVLGINDRIDLTRSCQVLRQRILMKWMRRGVTIIDPLTTQIEDVVRIGQDTVIGPFTCIRGKSRIGSHCEIQSHVVIEEAIIKGGISIPPFSWIKNQTLREK